MYGWGAVDFRICFSNKNHGYSISAKSYDFCPHGTQLYILDFTMSHIHSRGQVIIIRHKTYLTSQTWLLLMGGSYNLYCALLRLNIFYNGLHPLRYYYHVVYYFIYIITACQGNNGCV